MSHTCAIFKLPSPSTLCVPMFPGEQPEPRPWNNSPLRRVVDRPDYRSARSANTGPQRVDSGSETFAGNTHWYKAWDIYPSIATLLLRWKLNMQQWYLHCRWSCNNDPGKRASDSQSILLNGLNLDFQRFTFLLLVYRLGKRGRKIQHLTRSRRSIEVKHRSWRSSR